MHVKKLIGDVRVFVIDRNFTQIESIEIVWPDSKIIFCLRHIKKSIEDSVNKEMKNRFEEMMNNKITEDELIHDFETYIQKHPSTQASDMLQSLLDSRCHWLPSITSEYNHRGHYTTIMVEGFYGTLKNFTEHRIQSLGQLVKSVYICAENMFVTSRNVKQYRVPEVSI